MQAGTAIILHGKPDEEEYYSHEYPSPSNSHWIPWLQKQLLMQGTMTYTPEMPQPYQPVYEAWEEEFMRYPTPDIVISHSLGSGFILRYGAQYHLQLERLVLVAPWLDPTGSIAPFCQQLSNSWEPNRIDIVYSPSDPANGIAESVDMLVTRFPAATVHSLPTGGHFTQAHMGTPVFEELLAVVNA